ncbi:hypothetical protein EG329_013388 [Mollisiaceae sp. DMI_Dod_QoI]|nr:hypothetical protein EG329_013388 [Helotiales sp. DMI_Dod_QoI]
MAPRLALCRSKSEGYSVVKYPLKSKGRKSRDEYLDALDLPSDRGREGRSGVRGVPPLSQAIIASRLMTQGNMPPGLAQMTGRYPAMPGGIGGNAGIGGLGAIGSTQHASGTMAGRGRTGRGSAAMNGPMSGTRPFGGANAGSHTPTSHSAGSQISGSHVSGSNLPASHAGTPRGSGKAGSKIGSGASQPKGSIPPGSQLGSHSGGKNSGKGKSQISGGSQQGSHHGSSHSSPGIGGPSMPTPHTLAPPATQPPLGGGGGSGSGKGKSKKGSKN